MRITTTNTMHDSGSIILQSDTTEVSGVNIAADGGEEIIGSYLRIIPEYNQSYSWNSLQDLSSSIISIVNYDTTFNLQFEDGCERSLIETITIDSLYSFSPPAEITMDTEYSFELEIIDRANVAIPKKYI